MTTQPTDFTLADFLAWEALQDSKHEFSEGRISAFPGVTQMHSTIVVELTVRLHAHLRGTRGRVFVCDVMTTTQRSARYPDVVVTCDERDTADPYSRTLAYPKLIVEVLSESTAAVDRGPKLDEYRSIATLEEYVLIDSRRRWAEAYRRVDGAWIPFLPVSTGPLEFSSVGLTIDLDEFYDSVVVPVR